MRIIFQLALNARNEGGGQLVGITLLFSEMTENFVDSVGGAFNTKAAFGGHVAQMQQVDCVWQVTVGAFT